MLLLRKWPFPKNAPVLFQLHRHQSTVKSSVVHVPSERLKSFLYFKRYGHLPSRSWYSRRYAIQFQFQHKNTLWNKIEGLFSAYFHSSNSAAFFKDMVLIQRAAYCYLYSEISTILINNLWRPFLVFSSVRQWWKTAHAPARIQSDWQFSNIVA